MSVVIRLARVGRKNKTLYRIVAACKEKPRDSSFLEVLGTYDPTDKQKAVVRKERVDFWVSKGAKASDRVRDLLKQVAV
mgnify:CR=1 FL=1